MHEDRLSSNRQVPARNEENQREGAARFLLSRSVLVPNLALALFVGAVLSVTNQVDALLRSGWTAALQLKVLFNFLVPLTVASASTVIHRRRRCPEPFGEKTGSPGDEDAL